MPHEHQRYSNYPYFPYPHNPLSLIVYGTLKKTVLLKSEINGGWQDPPPLVNAGRWLAYISHLNWGCARSLASVHTHLISRAPPPSCKVMTSMRWIKERGCSRTMKLLALIMHFRFRDYSIMINNSSRPHYHIEALTLSLSLTLTVWWQVCSYFPYLQDHFLTHQRPL